jgi:hypothetical protein
MLAPGSAVPATSWFMIDRAVRAQKTCERDHHRPATEVYERQA